MDAVNIDDRNAHKLIMRVILFLCPPSDNPLKVFRITSGVNSLTVSELQ